ncbi:hypothetical protein [Nostoc sp. UHCC 0870]|uniref:hypothetical protein n=1 Tax=Nostoc sp. UHCC 0870 TaxID=2914041 RepID=UPI001EDDB619|nr:hypothetical protein [Nostoc sp. UHCC 0870]UKP00953.1 hypothetical protein L6494_27750 [Nostoc sp. UHCC 0870]
MNSFSSATSPNKNQDNNEVLVNVIVKQEADGRTVAIVPGLPELQVEASDVYRQVALRLRTTALAQIQQRLESHLAGAEIYLLPT